MVHTATNQSDGPGGYVTSSGIESHGSAAESLDDSVRRLVVERSHDLVVLCDLLGSIVYASPSWLSIGWDPHALTGVAIQDLIHPDDLGVAAAAGERLNAGSNVDAVTIRLRGRDGAYTWFEINGSQVLGEDGELRFILGAARDVSEREELRSRLGDLDAHDREPSQFGHGAEHGAAGAARVARAARDDPSHRRPRHHRGGHNRASSLRERRLGAAVREGLRRGAPGRAARGVARPLRVARS